jgi:hypothetical protein
MVRSAKYYGAPGPVRWEGSPHLMCPIFGVICWRDLPVGC